MNDVTRTSKEKLPDWLRRWYALKGEPRFREAADEIERLQALLALETGALEQACAAPVDAPLTVEQARAAHESNVSLSQMVDRFLAWSLPKSVCSDLCVTDSNYPTSRSGTNLLTADEARSMLEYVTRAAHEPPAVLAALQELVRLKRLKDQRYALMDLNVSDEERLKVKAALKEHEEKKDAAWDAAEAALAGASPPLASEPQPVQGLDFDRDLAAVNAIRNGHQVSDSNRVLLSFIDNLWREYSRASQPPVPEWRPIETAPGDGRFALVYRPLAEQTQDRPVDVKRLIGGNNHCWKATVPDGQEPYNPTDGACHVTHWMPLPSHPTKEVIRDLLAYGYAPGNYMSNCLTCGQNMQDVDKRCRTCKPCAEKKMRSAQGEAP